MGLKDWVQGKSRGKARTGQVSGREQGHLPGGFLRCSLQTENHHCQGRWECPDPSML